MKKVLIQGAFEIVNAGHIKVFEECRAQGDLLFVALNTNELLRDYKKREPVFPFEEKKLILEAIRFVDAVIPAPEFSPLALLKEYKIDVYCLSLEWLKTKDEEIAYMLAHQKSVFFTTDFGLTRTSQVKEKLLAESLAKL